MKIISVIKAMQNIYEKDNTSILGHDIAEVSLKLTLNTNQSINQL